MFVDRVKTLALAHSIRDRAIDLALTHLFNRQDVAHYHRLVFDFRWIVALVRDAGDGVGKTKSAGDFCG